MSFLRHLSTVAFLLFGAVATAAVFSGNVMPSGLAGAAEAIGLNPYPTTPGWLDRTGALSERDRTRLAELAGRGRNDAGEVIRSIRAGVRPDLTRYDFELLRQDRRRAMAAYPDVDLEKLLVGRWYDVSYGAKVPASFCKGNASTTAAGPGAPHYLDGPCFMTTVAAGFPERTDGPTATRFIEQRRARQRAEREARMAVDGYGFAMGGSGGSLTVDCKPAGKCVVTRAKAWDKRGKRWTFDFVPAEWAADPGGMDYEKYPSFRKATVEEVDVEPTGVAFRATVGTVNETKDVHGTVSPVAPPPPVPQR